MKCRRIAELAKENPQRAFTSLAYFIDLDWLREAYRRTRKDGATGVDRQSAEDYAQKLDENLRDLLDRAKSGRYQAPPVRRGRSALGASLAVREVLAQWHGGVVVELNIQKFFDTLDHKQLREFLGLRVRDGVLLRLIGKWLNAGVMEAGAVTRTALGTPQGGVISPLLANIYLHDVLDWWFAQEVVPRLHGAAELVRYAYDAIIVCRRPDDAERLMAVLPKRFGRFGLTQQHTALCRTLKGHYAYYGVTGNSRSLQGFAYETAAAWRYWLARRSGHAKSSWEWFHRFLRHWPLPNPRVVHAATW